jgi:hypothetical protein
MFLLPTPTSVLGVFLTMAFVSQSIRADFDLKATLLTHRQQHTNHLEVRIETTNNTDRSIQFS